MAKSKRNQNTRRPGRPKTAGDNAATLRPVPGEATEWPDGRPFRFCQRLGSDPDRRGAWTTRQVFSRDELEDIVVTEGIRSNWPAVRACRVVESFLEQERARCPRSAQILMYALDTFGPMFGHEPIGALVEKNMIAVREAMQATLSAAGVYSRMLRLRAMMDYALEHGFTDKDAIGEQVMRFRPVTPDRPIHDPEVFEPFRSVADIDQCVVFDMSCGRGATERHITDLIWPDVDLVRGWIYLQPVYEEGEQDAFGDWVQLEPRELLALVQLRIHRIKQDRFGDERVFEHWKTDHGVVGAINAMQFKHHLIEAAKGVVTHKAQAVPPSDGAPSAAAPTGDAPRLLARTTPTTYPGAYDYRDFRYSAGRRAAAGTRDIRTVGRAASLSHFKTVKRLFGPYMPALRDEADDLAGESAVLRSLLYTGGKHAQQD
jgi:hypothetical protein